MAKQYTRIHSNDLMNAGVPNAQPSITIGAGMKQLVKIKMPSEGRLVDVDVFQVAPGSGGGAAVAFTVTILKSMTPFPVNQDVPVAQAPVVDTASLEVSPVITVATPGNHAQLQDDNIGFAYRNVDGGWTNNQRFLYVLIDPTGAGSPTMWNIFLSAESCVGGE